MSKEIKRNPDLFQLSAFEVFCVLKWLYLIKYVVIEKKRLKLITINAWLDKYIFSFSLLWYNCELKAEEIRASSKWVKSIMLKPLSLLAL